MNLVAKSAKGIFEPRVQIAGYWGVPTYGAQSVNYTGHKAFDLAKKVPGFLAGVSVWGETRGEGPTQDVLASGYTLPSPTSPIWTIWNSKGGWTAETVSNAVDWEPVPDPFRTGAALLYSNANPNANARFVGPTNVRANGSFLFRLGLIEIDNKTQKYQNVGLVFGGAPYTFRLEWNKGVGGSHTVWLHRLLPEWTIANQRELDMMAVQARETKEATGADVVSFEAAFWAKWHSLYAQSDKLDLGLGSFESKAYGQYLIVPEPALNRVRVFGNVSPTTGNGRASSGDETTVDIVPHPLETGARRSVAKTQLWGATSLKLDTNGGMMMWQEGTPDWNRNSIISLPSSLGGGAAIGGHWDETQPGTDVKFVLEPLPPSEDPLEGAPEEQFKPRIELVSDGLYPALLYDAYGWRDGGARNGDTAFVWDSDDHKVLGAAQFFDVVPSCDGPLNRLTLRVTMSMHNQDLIGSGTYQRLFHDRMAKVMVNGETILGNGLILRAFGNGWRYANRTLAPIQATGPNSRVEWEIVDLWQLADEWLIREDPILDGLDLGTALRRLLRLPGTLISEMAGIPINTGIILDRAEVGQAACERPAYEASVGDAIRALMVKYAPDWGLSPRSGVWTLTPPSNVFVARFCQNPQPGQTPPEFPLFDDLDVIRDFTEFCNDFRLTGGPSSLDARDVANAPPTTFGGGNAQQSLQGERVAVNWFNRPSATYGAALDHIGRIKRAKTVHDEGKSTQGTATRAVRGVAKLGGELGRFHKFGTVTILNLYPGDKVLVEDTPERLESIGDGSISYGQATMAVTTRELR